MPIPEPKYCTTGGPWKDIVEKLRDLSNMHKDDIDPLALHLICAEGAREIESLRANKK